MKESSLTARKSKGPRAARAQTPSSSGSRYEILAAAVRCLVRRGLHGTSTLQIQAEAGISRGKLLHHFPSKHSLLVAAVQHLAAERFEALRGEPIPFEGAARARRAVELMWSTYDGDLFWAAMELWVGARTDPDLRAVLAVEERRLGRFARGLCDDLFGAELTRRPGYNSLRDVLIASMRGVAMTYAFDERDRATEHHLPMWQDLAVHRLGLANS